MFQCRSPLSNIKIARKRHTTLQKSAECSRGQSFWQQKTQQAIACYASTDKRCEAILLSMSFKRNVKQRDKPLMPLLLATYMKFRLT